MRRGAAVGLVCLGTAMATVAGCSGGAPKAGQGGTGSLSQDLISDQFHNGGTRGFVLLPPMVPPPDNPGGLLADVPATVRIDERDGRGATLRTLATFTRTTGPEREHIRFYKDRVKDCDDHDGDEDESGYYLARWETNDAHLSPAGNYRVHVLVPRRGGGQKELGFADVAVVRDQKAFKSVDKQSFAPLINGSVLRIKFRIDVPAVDQDGDGVFDWKDNCPTLANKDQKDSLGNAIGDACRCLNVTCTALDACHTVGACQKKTGTCTNPPAVDGASCPIVNATGACAAGACALTSCDAGFADCDQSLTNGCETPTTTTTSCGACGTACVAGAHSAAVCTSGKCALSCSPGFADCDGQADTGCERAITDDAASCGGCGVACAIDQVCMNSACTNLVCGAGTADCDHVANNGCEVTLASDVKSCGACGNACALPNATPSCTAGACAVASCSAGYVDCNHVATDGCEINAQGDIANCGGCGAACAFANATAACSGGACALAACNTGYADCHNGPSDGCETGTQTDVASCGSCGNACSLPNATPACAGGECAIASCAPGFTDCNGEAGDGCEVHTDADPTNCGACGIACPFGAGSTATCGGGKCGIACAAGFADCNGQPGDGCERGTTTDASNCGGCGVTCGMDELCANGGCTPLVCGDGTADCDHLAADGCEVNPAADPGNCGGCGNVCSLSNAVAQCVASACGFSVCSLGYMDCDGLQANGCEINLKTDLNNCGGCGSRCNLPGGVAACVDGACRLVACAAGFADCNRDGTSCEINTSTDPASCGDCGTVCSAGSNAVGTCAAGSCGFACVGTFAHCDGKPGKDCETDTSSDSNNCGGCGAACRNHETCQGGACTTASCQPGYADCNGAPDDGCEADLTSDVANCGRCYAGCGFANAAASCVNSACVMLACRSGSADCNHDRADGCEVTLATDPANCSACGSACVAANGTPGCLAGACTVSACAAGFGDCNGLPGDGCEVATTSALANCGACNSPCLAPPPFALATCASSTCGWVCRPGRADCNGQAADGCEIDLTTSIGNCGACNHACDNNTTCVSGACSTVACVAGTADCDSDPANGCEANLASDVAHCGSCSNPCAYAHATAACGSSVCSLVACAAPWGDCDHSAANGCETDTSTSRDSCGGCGVRCAPANATGVCTNGACGIAGCDPSFSDCNARAADGCESNRQTDPNNCGKCGVACASGVACAGGRCVTDNGGSVTTLAGNGTPTDLDGQGTAAALYAPYAIALDGDGAAYVTTSGAGPGQVRVISPLGLVSTLKDPHGAAWSFPAPWGVAVDHDGNVYVTDESAAKVFKITPGGVQTTLAGDGTRGYRDGAGAGARFFGPVGAAVDAAGNVYVADYLGQRIRLISPAGVVTTLAGSGITGSLDGPAAGAQFNGPYGVAVDGAGAVYVSEMFGYRIRKIAGGVVTTLAGSGTPGASDGPGLAASFSAPTGLGVDGAGNVYVADSSNDRLRRVTPAGVVSTVAGGAEGFADGVGPAARFNLPRGIAVTAAGVVFVADTANNRVRVVR